ncbi:MAG: catalase family protein [Terriglobales bacterium]
MNARTKRAALGLVVIAVLAYFVFRPAPRGPMGESISAGETYLTAQIVASALKMVNTSQHYMTNHPLPGYPPKVSGAPAPPVQAGTVQPTSPSAPNSQPYRRDVHSKTHGCLKSTFTVLDNLNPKFRFGLFAKPGRYQSWVRYSSGNEYPQPDSTRDARGMAIKVMGVGGKKLLEEDGLPPASTQDFPLMNATQFFIRDIDEYAEFTKYLSSGLGARAKYGYFLGGFPIPNPFNSHLHEMMLALKTLKPAPDSLLNTQYYSVSAFELGPELSVKYSARPCKDSPAADVDRSDPNFLRLEMVKRLSAGGACFDFMVQRQIPGKNMPVEDTTVEWSEDDSPFVPVARLDIPSQQFEQNNNFCEDLSFTPWHSLPEHRPIGVMNRIRKAVYLEVSRYRRQMNGAQLCEPADPAKTTPPNNWYELDKASCEQPGTLPPETAQSSASRGSQ